MEAPNSVYHSIDLIVMEYVPSNSKHVLLVTDYQQSSVFTQTWKNTKFLLWKDEFTDLKTSGFYENPSRNIELLETQDHDTIPRQNETFDWIYDAYILNKCFVENKKKDF